MVFIDTMNKQLNLRLPETLLKKATAHAKNKGYATVQEFIKEILRERLYEEITPKEAVLLKKLTKLSEEKNLFGTQEELFAKLR